MFKNLKIRYKLLLSFLILSVVSLLSISLFFYQSIYSILLDHTLAEGKQEVFIESRAIDSFIKVSENDILFLKELSSLNNLINAIDNEAAEMEKKRLQSNFLSFAQKKKEYYQLRYLDEKGNEVVRIDSDGKKPVVIDDKNLQNKKDRYYFQDTMSLSEGEIFVSPLDLNVERGEVEIPHKPVIRYASRVFDNEGNSKGVVIANIRAEFLDDLQEGLKGVSQYFLTGGEGNEVYLVNHDGYYLSHPDPQKEWGFMFDNDETIHKDAPEIAKQIFTEDSGQFFYNKWYSYITFSHDAGNWILVSAIDRHFINDQIISFFYGSFLIVLVTLVAVIITALFLSKLISDPITKLQKGVQVLKKGVLSHRVEIESLDEAGVLAQGFNEMSESLEKNKAEVEKKVNERTSQLEKLNQAMVGRELKMIELKKEIEKKKVDKS